MKCNKRFVKFQVDSPNLQFISKLSASLYYLLLVNFCSKMFFFFRRKSFLFAFVTLPSAGVAILARLTIAVHSCSNKHSMERVVKVKNADKAKKATRHVT